MKRDIILAGVGGQGIVSIATIIGYASVESGLYMKQSEVHGMSQRGGDVQSHLRISDKEIFSDLVPFRAADMILSVEPMESLRYLPYLAPDGWVITNSTPFVNIPNYPKIEDILAEIKKLPKNIILNAEEMAKKAGSSKAMNVVMAGAASLFLGLDVKKLEEGIWTIFGRKGNDVVTLNLQAFHAGREFAQAHS